MKTKIMMLLLACIFIFSLCNAVSAENTTNSTDNCINSTPLTNVNITDSHCQDPVISGVVLDNSTHTGLANATVNVWDTDGNKLAETLTHNDGTYSVGFINSNTVFTVIASKMNYTINAKEIIVIPSSDPNDPNFYGTANFTLYKVPAYSGSASSYALNVGALPAILLDIYAGRSSAWVNSSNSPYSRGDGVPLEVRLLSGSLLAGLLNIASTGDQGTVTGGLLPDSIPSLEATLQSLGLDVGLLNATAYSSTNPPESIGGSNVASLALALNLLLLKIPIVDVDLITANSSVTPYIANSIVISTSSAGVTNISILGGVLEIEALQSNARASVNGQPGGANADFDWSVADIKLLGSSILDNLKANLVVELPGVLRISLGGENDVTSADGTYARASGDALNVQLLGLLLGGITLTIGHAEAEAQVPAGGLNVNADLVITKTVNNSNPNYGDQVTFTITAHNNGPYDATNVTVPDPLPHGLTFVSSNGSYDPATGIWTIGNLANGATVILHIIAQVADYATMTNIVVISGDEPDQDITNNQDNVTVTTNAADLEITKIVNNSNPTYGDTVTFILTARNNGPDNATNVTVNDTLPAGLSLVSSNGYGTYANGVWNIGNLANGATVILQIIAQVTDYATMTNIAVINGDEPDQNDTNNHDEATVTTNAADLSITKIVDDPNPHFGDIIMFTLTAHNYGPDNASNVIVTDSLPSGLHFDHADSAYNPESGEWTIGDLNNGMDALLHIWAQVTAYNQMTNIATILGDEPDQNDTNDQDNVTVITNASDLEITKTVDNSNPNYGDQIAFTLTAHNYGPANATNVIVNDTLPQGLTFVSSNGYGTYTNGIWNIGNLANGATVILQIIAQVTDYATMTNIAVIQGNEPDQNDTNNDDNVTVTTNAADLSIIKTVNNSNPNYGDTVTFTLTVHNGGPDNATNVIVNDTLPQGLTFVSADGAYDSTTSVWTIGNLANGATAILHIIAQVADYATMTNTAVISGAEPDQDDANNQDSATVTTNIVSDLAITKVVDKSIANLNEILHYTITVTNNGPDPSANFTVNDFLPGGLNFQSADTHGTGIYDPNTGFWTINTLASGSSAVLDLFAQITQSNIIITNTALVNDPNDPNPDNNQDQTTTTINPVHDLEIIKTVDKRIANVGEELNYTITVINHGPDLANNIIVNDSLPNGLQLISTDGTYNNGIITWIIPALTGNNAQTILNIRALITQSGTTITNTATMDQTNDPDTTNNQDTITTTVNPVYDLSVTKEVDKSPVFVGETVTFTIIVRNNGPDEASDVRVIDRLPAGLEFISANSTHGTYDPETGVWNIGTIQNNDFEIIIIKAKTLTLGTLVNEAEIGESIYDPVLGNNIARATVQVNALPDISITPNSPDTPISPNSPVAKAPPVHAKTIPMKKTGVPFGGIIMAVMLVFAGMSLPRRK